MCDAGEKRRERKKAATARHPPLNLPSHPSHPIPPSHLSTASVSFPSPAAAAVAAAALGVDPELRPALVSRAVWADGDRVRFRFAAADARVLRAAACTFCDLGGVAARAVEAFPPKE